MSTFNRLGDVRANIAVVRKLWPETIHEYRLYLCYTEPKLADEARIDKLGLSGSCIGRYKASGSTKTGRRFRSLTSGLIATRLALDDACDYAMHFHADACVIHPAWIDEYITEMNNEHILAAARGLGFSVTGRKTPQGDIDDHFYIVSHEIDKRFFVEPDVNEMHKYAPEGILGRTLSTIFSTKPEKFRLFHRFDPQEKKQGISRRMHPFNYDEKRFLIHTPNRQILFDKIVSVYGDRAEEVRADIFE